MVRLWLERGPAALLARGRTCVYLGKRAIWPHSLRRPPSCLPSFLCPFLLTQGSTPALSKWIGLRCDRDRDFFHLTMVVNGPVDGRRLAPIDPFCARFHTLALRPSAAPMASAEGGPTRRERSTSGFRSVHTSLHTHERRFCSAVHVCPSACTNAIHIICMVHCT